MDKVKLALHLGVNQSEVLSNFLAAKQAERHRLAQTLQINTTPKRVEEFLHTLAVRVNDGLQKPRNALPRVPLVLYLEIAYQLHKVNFILLRPCQAQEELFTLLVPWRR